MKRIIKNMIFLAIFICYIPVALANSGPVYWQGYPASGVMVIDANSPVIVTKEDLLFDFSEGKSDYTIGGKVAATYQMQNPTKENLLVQMAFPFVGDLRGFSRDDILITADGEFLPYKLYIGDVVNSYGSGQQTDKEISFDFAGIVGAISEKPYQAVTFRETENARLYIIDVEPTSDSGVNLVLEFDTDENKKIFFNGFSSYRWGKEKATISTWSYQPEKLEILVLGGDLDLEIRGYKDGGKKEETELFSYQISAEDIEIKSYLMRYIEENAVLKDNDILADTQTYNLFARILDQHFAQNGFCNGGDLNDQNRYKRIMILLYTVEFPHSCEKEVMVNYRTTATMDITKTTQPLYSFDYIFNPARNWASFQNLNIKVIPPKEAPYIVKSSVDFDKGNDGVYTAALNQLPKEDLQTSFYSREKITTMDIVKGKIQSVSGILSFVVIYIGIPLLALLLSAAILILLVKKAYKKLK